jgi:hypothetical protein
MFSVINKKKERKISIINSLLQRNSLSLTKYSSATKIENKYNIPSKNFSLSIQPYLDNVNQCYKNIIVINRIPQGPLAKYIKFINFPLLSEFKTYNSPCINYIKCGYVLTSFNNSHLQMETYSLNKNCCDLMSVNEIPELISFLMENNYRVENNITQTLNSNNIIFNNYIGNKLILFATYLGK